MENAITIDERENVMATQVKTYGKPSMFLEGEIGREIFDYILNTPKPDLTELYKEVELEEKKWYEERKNES